MGFSCLICEDCLELAAPNYSVGTNQIPPGSANAAAPLPKKKNNGKKHTKFGRWNHISKGETHDIVATPCGHLFHRICLAGWFKDKNTASCPACRKTCYQANVIKLYPDIALYYPGMEDNAHLLTPGTAAGSSQGLSLGQGHSNQLRLGNDTGTGIVCPKRDCTDIRLRNQTLDKNVHDLQMQLNSTEEELELTQAKEKNLAIYVKILQSEIELMREERERPKQDCWIGIRMPVTNVARSSSMGKAAESDLQRLEAVVNNGRADSNDFPSVRENYPYISMSAAGTNSGATASSSLAARSASPSRAPASGLRRAKRTRNSY